MTSTRYETLRAGATAWRLMRLDTWAFAISWLAWTSVHVAPIVAALLVRQVVDRATTQAGAGVTTAVLAAGAFELLRRAHLPATVRQFDGLYNGWKIRLRDNVLRPVLEGPGPTSGRLGVSPGEVVARLRDDADDLVLLLDTWLDLTGLLVAWVAGLAALSAIDPALSLAGLVPMAVTLAAAFLLGPRLREWRRRMREAGAGVTAFIADLFSSVLAVKVSGAEPQMLDRLATLNQRRRKASVVDELAGYLLQALSGVLGAIGLVLVLLLAIPAVQAGRVTAGDLTLCAVVIAQIAVLSRFAVRLVARQQQAGIALDRMAATHPPLGWDDLVAPQPLWLRSPAPLPDPVVVGDALVRLDVRGLTVHHDDAGHGVTDVSFSVEPGEMVVVTGPVGSGKSTLARALVGALPLDAGTIVWNGVAVRDAAVELAPPRFAYLSQLPRLFSDTVADNVLLGQDPVALADALWLACVEGDVAAMAEGADTLIGPRGVRLSGGQRQRVAAARMLARPAEVLVVDDISSALDAETEARLWSRLSAAGRTCIVISDRPEVLARADHLVRLAPPG